MKLSKKIISEFSEFLDKIIPLKGLMESFDGIAIRTVLSLLNNNYGKLIPDELTPRIEAFLSALMIEDWNLAGSRLSELLALIINTPFIDGTQEEIDTFNMIISMLVEKIQAWIEHKKQQ